jgi:hypothetical protein
LVEIPGLYVTPGLIDLHAHVFAGSSGIGLAGGHASIFPDDFALRVGATTVVAGYFLMPPTCVYCQRGQAAPIKRHAPAGRSDHDEDARTGGD